MGGFDTAITNTNAYTTVSNLQVKTDDNNYSISSQGTTFNRLLENCLFSNFYTAGVAISGKQTTTKNCIFILTGSSQNGIAQLYNQALFYNCTFVAPSNIAVKPTYEINQAAGNPAPIFIKCAFFGGSALSDNGGGDATFLYCYSDIADANHPDCTQATYNNTQFVDTTADWRIPTGSALKNAVPADIDIAGTSRPSGASCDVGAWEFYVAPTPAASGGGGEGKSKHMRG